MRIIKEADMADFTSFRAGGEAETFVIVDSEEELRELLGPEIKTDYVLIGNGTNTLFASESYSGLVIKLGEAFDYIDIEDDGILSVGAATLLSKLSNAAANEGLTGLEFAGGIPGSVGGAIFMNAGAYDGEIRDVLVSVDALVRGDDGAWEKVTIPAEELDLSYRHSVLMEREGIILRGVFKLARGVKEDIRAKMKDYSGRRSSKQPLEYPSAGSFFKRPEGFFAGKLIQDAGLAGLSVGGAQVSEKHCGFIINKGGATPEDILTLMEKVQAEVKEKFDVTLEPEIRIIK